MIVIACCLWMLSVAGSPAQTPAKPVTPSAVVNMQPTLTDMNDLYVVVEVRRYPAPDPNGSKFSLQLENLVQAQLEEAKIHISGQTKEAMGSAVWQILARRIDRLNIDPNSLRWRRAGVPVLRVTVNVLPLEADTRAGLYVQTSLSRLVRLDGRNGRSFMANVWSTEPIMKFVPAARWQDDVRTIIRQQVDSFVTAHRAVATGGNATQQ